MGVIQNSVNNMIGTAGVIAGLAANSPEVKAYKEKQMAIKTAKSRIEAYNDMDAREEAKYQKSVKDLMNKYIDPDTGSYREGLTREQYDTEMEGLKTKRNEVLAVTGQKRTDIYNEMFELTGSEDWLHEAAQSQELTDIRKRQLSSKDARIRAINSMSDAQEQKRTRRNFMDYLRRTETSLGGKVGEFAPDIQKQIASQYSPKQRKALMDQMDREAKK